MAQKKVLSNAEIAQQASKEFVAYEALFEDYRKHAVFHIEAWETITFIPGGVVSFRTHYLYDRTARKAFFRDHHGKTIKLVDDPKAIRQLEKFVRYHRKAYKEGIFVRELARVDWGSPLFDLMGAMNGERATLKLPEEIENKRTSKRREKRLIKLMFNSVVSTQ